MSEWQVIWLVTIKYANLADNGGYPFREVRAETAADLRRIVQWARQSRKVIGFPYKRIRERVGHEPTACRNGHPYAGTSSVRVGLDWTDCICGGHFVYLCRGGCNDARVDPPAYVGCVASDSQLAAKARNRRQNS